MLTKKLQEIRIKAVVQWWNYCYQRNKPEANQSYALRWTYLSTALKRILLGKHAHRAFNWPKYAYI